MGLEEHFTIVAYGTFHHLKDVWGEAHYPGLALMTPYIDIRIRIASWLDKKIQPMLLYVFCGFIRNSFCETFWAIGRA